MSEENRNDEAPPRDDPGGRDPGGRGPAPGIWQTWGRLRLLAWAVVCLMANAAVQATAWALADNIFVAVTAGGLLGVLLPCALVARAGGGSLRRDFALTRPPAAVLFWAAVTAAASLVPTSLLADLSARLHPVPQEWQDLYAAQLPRTAGATVGAFLAVVVVAPLAEELLFRGIVQRLAARVWGALPAMALAALAFALLHGEPWYLFGLVGIGLVLGFVWAATGSVTACAVAHGVHNAAALTMMLREGTDGAGEAGFGGSTGALLALSLAALALGGFLLARAAGRDPARRADQR